MAATELGHRHPEARRLRELLRDPSARRDASAFVLEGPRLVDDALDRGVALERVYVGPNAERSFAALLARVGATGVETRVLKEGVLEKLGTTRTPQPVLAIAAMPPPSSLASIAPGIVVVTAGVHDPGNLGTILRSAEAAGATAVVACDGVDVWSPKVVRASAGAVLGIPVVVPDRLGAALEELRARGWRVVGADAAAPLDYGRADLRGQIAVVVGGEAHGLPADVEPAIDERVSIPMAGSTESLNVGVAASIVLFEAARQARG